MKNFLFTLLAFFSLTSHHTFSQDTINKSSEYGFYVKNGANKKLITELGCYSFDELWAKFPITQEMFGYDNIVVRIYQLNSAGGIHQYCGYGFDGNVFKAKYTGKESGELIIFSKGRQEHSFKTGAITRGSMAFAPNNKAAEAGAHLVIEILGQTITGYAEELVGNRYVRTPTYSSADLLYKSTLIPLKNREKKVSVYLPIGGRVGSLDVDLSQPCTE